MQITKTYRFKLRLTKKQEATIDRWIGTCRHIYNVAKETREWSYKATGKSPSMYELMRQLKYVRAEFDWVRAVPAQTLQDVIQRLERSYKNFFEGRANYPQWAKKHRYNSITFKSVKQHTHNRLKLLKIGSVKYFASQKMRGKLQRATIVREADGYYIAVLTKQEIQPVTLSHESQVGIDAGISYFAVTSDGKYIANPAYLKASLRQLRIEQRSLSRKKLRGKNWEKQKRRVQKLHLKVKRQRKDFLHKLTTRLVAENSTIVVEDLNIKGMVRSRLGRSISDASWGEFQRQLAYKAEWAGRTFVKVPAHYSSQECSVCGHTAKENRVSQSVFRCVECGHEANADFDAAKVILRRGTSDLAGNVGRRARA